MEGIDPRLRDSAPRHSELHQTPPSRYSGVQCQGAGYDTLPCPSANTSAGQSQPQPHQYYRVSTPGSFSSGQHQDGGGSPYERQDPPDPSDPNDLKRPRACEACRQLKVKCEPHNNSSSGSCRRCVKAGRQCVVTAPSRKRQKKTDSRVAELEKKIDALTATLHAQRRPGSGDSPLDPAIAQVQMAETEQRRGQIYHQPVWQDTSAESHGVRQSDNLLSPRSGEGAGGGKRKFKSEMPVYNHVHDGVEQQTRRSTQSNPPHCNGPSSVHPLRAIEARGPSYIDTIDRQIIDAPTAYRIFERFNSEPHVLPVVVFRPGTRAEEIRRSKPLLFLAILSAASNTIRPDLQPTFVAEVLRLLADRIICRGEKTVEIVQSLLVITIWYQPPARYEELNFNQLIHTAAVVGTDIGMGKRSRPGHAASPWRENMSRAAHADPDAAETRRSWLGLYFLCGNAAMSLRRPLLVRWSPYVEESLEVLGRAPDAAPSDKLLAHLVRLQHIAEEVGYQFSMDDPASDVSITEPKVQYQVKMFEKQLEEWRRNASKDMPPGLLQHNEAIVNLYIHEIAMHHSHNIDDFRPPYGVSDEHEIPDYITPAHIDSLTICLDSIHRAIDAFIEMPIATIRFLPTVFFVRNSYAAAALIKMYTAVSATGSKLGSVFKPKDLKVEHYLDAMIDRMKRAAEGGQCAVAMRFTLIITMLRSWQAKRAAGFLTGKDKTILSIKAFSAGWEKQNQVGAPTRQEPETSSWNRLSVAAGGGGGGGGGGGNLTAGQESQHAGLQMLSEAAMGNNNTSSTSATSYSASAAAAALAASNTSQAAWPTPLAAYTEVAPPQQQTSPPPPQQQSTSNVAADAFSLGDVGDLDGFTFTAEDLSMLGNMMQDPTWLNFGLGSGWVM